MPTGSIVIPAFNEAENLPKLVQELTSGLAGHEMSFEVIIVNDGSSDDTEQVFSRLEPADNFTFSLLTQARNIGQQRALRAGFQAASGDFLISMDADLQHPVYVASQMIEAYKKGHDCVVALRHNENSGFYKIATSRLYYLAINRLSGTNLRPGSSDFYLLDHSIFSYLNQFKEDEVFLRGHISKINAKNPKYINYTPDERFSGKSKYTLRAMMKLAFLGMAWSTTAPLRLAIVLAIFCGLIAITFTTYAFYIYFSGDSVPGWASTIALISSIGTAQFFCMAIIGEYLARALQEARQRPLDETIRAHTISAKNE